MSRPIRGSILVATLLLLGCSPAAWHARVPLPADGSTARHVLDVYLQALVAGDCETVKALTASGREGLCGAVSGVTTPREIQPVADTVGFLVTLTISGGDGSMSEGPNLWTYWLGRGTDGDWRIVNEGMG